MENERKFQAPDWKSYEIKGIKQLEKTQRLLAGRGLKDPWIRNEVWRYRTEGQWKAAARSLGRGLKWALVAMVVTYVADGLFLNEARKRVRTREAVYEPGDGTQSEDEEGGMEDDEV